MFKSEFDFHSGRLRKEKESHGFLQRAVLPQLRGQHWQSEAEKTTRKRKISVRALLPEEMSP